MVVGSSPVARHLKLDVIYGWIGKEESHITKVLHLLLETRKLLELNPVERFQSSHGPQVRDAPLDLVCT